MIIWLTIKIIPVFGTDVRFTVLPWGNIDIQVSIRPFVNGPVPTVAALEDQQHLVASVWKIAYANGILQVPCKIAINRNSVRS